MYLLIKSMKYTFQSMKNQTGFPRIKPYGRKSCRLLHIIFILLYISGSYLVFFSIKHKNLVILYVLKIYINIYLKHISNTLWYLLRKKNRVVSVGIRSNRRAFGHIRSAVWRPCRRRAFGPKLLDNDVHTDKSFRNLIKLNWNQIVFTIFRFWLIQ